MDVSPILITGVPRSGATMIAAALNLCGAFTGEISKRGMFSNDRIREEMVKPYLKRHGADENVFKDFPQYISIPTTWKDDIEVILSQEGYRGGAWMYKDSRINQMWQVWSHAYPEAKWVIVRRKTSDIVESCLKTGYMRAYSDRDGWLQMVHEYENRFVEMITEGLNCKVIWPERMINGDYRQLYELCDWVGLKWKDEALEFINSLLWKTRQKERSIQ